MFNGILWAFLIGGIICALAQIVMDLTCLPPAHIMVLTVMTGALLGALGWYEPLLKLGQAGAFIPLTSFGNSLFEGALEGIEKSGFLGAFTGVFKETSLGLSFAVFMGWLISLIFNPKG